MQKNLIVTGFDDNYLFPFLVMIYSAKKNSNTNFHLKIAFSEDLLSRENRLIITSLLNLFNITFELIPISLAGELKSQDHISITAFSRLYLADTLTEKFLWLDCDLICRPGWDDIFLEYASVIEDHSVCAAIDAIPIKYPLGYDFGTKNAAMSRMGQNYFNSGVLIVNPMKWRTINENEHWSQVYSNYELLGFQFADQCILNYLCFQSFHHLAPNYNYFATIRKEYVAEDEIKILHFPGREKPWTYKKYQFATFFGSIKARYIHEYLDMQCEMIEAVKNDKPEIAIHLSCMAKTLFKKRALKHLLLIRTLKIISQ